MSSSSSPADVQPSLFCFSSAVALPDSAVRSGAKNTMSKVSRQTDREAADRTHRWCCQGPIVRWHAQQQQQRKVFRQYSVIISTKRAAARTFYFKCRTLQGGRGSNSLQNGRNKLDSDRAEALPEGSSASQALQNREKSVQTKQRKMHTK